jgi:hypothetical protein
MKWNKGGMVPSAISDLGKGEVGLKTAAKLHNVPRSTLQRYVITSLNPKDAVTTALGHKTISSRDTEVSY